MPGLKIQLKTEKKQVVKEEWNIANDELVLINNPLLPQELPAKFSTAAPHMLSCRRWPSRAGCCGGVHNADMAHGLLQTGFAQHQREFYLRLFISYLCEWMFVFNNRSDQFWPYWLALCLPQTKQLYQGYCQFCNFYLKHWSLIYSWMKIAENRVNVSYGNCREEGSREMTVAFLVTMHLLSYGKKKKIPGSQRGRSQRRCHGLALQPKTVSAWRGVRE